MKVNFPSNCTTEASRWSFTVKLNEKLRVWHNDNCAGMTAKEAETWRKDNFYSRLNAVMQARNEQIDIARGDLTGERKWKATLDPDAVIDDSTGRVKNGSIEYPVKLNKSNEGSRASLLFGLNHKLSLTKKDIDDPDMEAVQSAISQAKKDAIKGIYWNPSLENIN